MPVLTVVIPTHNPDRVRLQATLNGLYLQTLSHDQWDVIIINNASTRWPNDGFFTGWKRGNLTIVEEPILGLTSARMRGFITSTANIVVLVDDDNVLAPDYLARAVELLKLHPRLGAAGGKSLPQFETPPPDWSREFFPLLALRDLGDTPIMSSASDDLAGRDLEYPGFSPIGAGMVLRREAWITWLDKTQRGIGILGDRCGTQLTSGGDNDIVFTLLRAGWAIGYFPELSLTHLIPTSRLSPSYLARLNRGIQESWMRVLTLHRANPWLPLSHAGAHLRKIKAWFTHRAWKTGAGRIRWQGACGHFDGRVRVTNPSTN
jgi:glycosyltransferase involved in cell wall biosynthesis